MFHSFELHFFLSVSCFVVIVGSALGGPRVGSISEPCVVRRSHFSFSSSLSSPTSFFFIFMPLKRYLICRLIGGGEMTHAKMQITKKTKQPRKKTTPKNPNSLKTHASERSDEKLMVEITASGRARAMSIMIIVTMIIIKISRAPKIESTRSAAAALHFFLV